MPTISLTDPVAHTNADAGVIATNNANLRTLLNSGLDPVNLLGNPALASGEVPVWNGSAWARSSVTRIGATSLGSGTPDSTKFLRGDGSWQVVTASATLVGIQILSGSGTYTPTSGTTRIVVEAVGGGGAGGGVPSLAANAQGGGGGGGAYAMSLITSGFSGVAYAVGAGGTGVSNANGNAGADTTFNSTVVVAKAGLGGIVGASATDVLGGVGGLASASTGTFKEDGQDGDPATSAGGSQGGGSGGDSHFGHGGRRIITGGNGPAGKGFGGGGAGAREASDSVAHAGGAGTAGTIRVWEFA